MDKPDFLLGHESLGRRPNVQRELNRIRRDPLEVLLKTFGADKVYVLSSEYSRYREAYWNYYLSLDRYLREMSIAARYSHGPYEVLHSGGTRKYTSAEHRLADKHKKIAPFLEYDLVNCLIHSRILLDRTVGLSRFFLTGKRLPSFTSFNKHKKFFARLSRPFGDHEEYAEYLREETEWFEMPLKTVRDKFVVHAAPKHMRSLGYPWGGYELDLFIILPDGDDLAKPLAKVKVILVSALRLSYDIERFLKWFNKYGVSALINKAPNKRLKSDAQNLHVP